MSMRQQVEKLFAAGAVNINGSEPWDIQVKDDRFYARILAEASFGLGESYVDDWWDCGQIDAMITRLLRCNIQSRLKPSFTLLSQIIYSKVINLQSKRRAFQIGEVHYDLGNDLYQAMLDRRLTYTCGYWQEATNLDQAQEAKLDLVCRKIGLKSGQRILDIGCGWGSFAKFAAENYGVSVVGITVSKEQVKLGQELCRNLPIELQLLDYRHVNGQFDHIVSLGMFEHVGHKNHRTFFEVVRRCLKNEGLFLLHTIGANRSYTINDPWINKYIFPNSLVPSAKHITSATEGLFVMEDWHNFSVYYDQTLMAWHQNFQAHWSELSEHYDQRFKRMWQYYLLVCAGAFRARVQHVWQIVFSKHGIPGIYQSIR